VHVRGHHTVLHVQHAGAAQDHVLADGGNQVGDFLGHRAAGAGKRRRLDGVDILADIQRDAGTGLHERLEGFVTCNEVGFRIHFHHGAAVGRGGDAHEALGRHAPALFGGGRQAFLAQPVDGIFDAAIGFGERALAIHHAGAGFLAQFLDQGGGDFSHVCLHSCRYERKEVLLLGVAVGKSTLPAATKSQKFFGSFFQKRTTFLACP